MRASRFFGLTKQSEVLLKPKLFFFFFLLSWMMFIPENKCSAVESIVFRGGYLWQNPLLNDGYGEFLKDRFQIQQLTLEGGFLEAISMLSSDLGVGFELSLLNNKFEYETLNRETETGTIMLQQGIVTVHWVFEDKELVGGIGINELSRELAGFKGETILSSNVNDSNSKKLVATTGTVVMIEAIYHLFGEALRGEIGVRWSHSVHEIPVDDDRPAYDEKLIPKKTNFSVGGFGYFLALAVEF